MGLYRILFAFIVILSSHSLFAQEGQAGLFFPLNRTDTQILPQRFEYQMINRDQFRIGDILMDARKVEFQIKSLPKKEYELIFRWPAGLLTDGEVAIKDNTGKTLWRKFFQKDQVQIQTDSAQTGVENLNTSSAFLKFNDFDSETLKKIKMYPFFKFCIQKEEQLTKMYLCSKEMYFQKVKNKSIITPRDSLREESYVEINGQPVQENGIIYLQSVKEPISLRAQLLSGATIELDTRLKQVDFKDIYLTDEGKIFVEASGAEPVHEEDIIKRTPDGWVTELSKKRSFLYMQGEGNIPMRQEFILGQNIRPQNLQITYKKKPPSKTYASQETIYLEAPQSIQISSDSKKSKVTKASDTEWVWDINGLGIDSKNRNYLTVIDGDKKYIAAHDITRAKRNEISTHFYMYPVWFDVKYQYWLSNYFGVQTKYENYLQKSSSEPALQNISLDVRYRLTPGVHLIDPSHGITAGLDQYIVDAVNLTTFTIGTYLNFKTPRMLSAFGDILHVELSAPLPTSAGAIILTSGYKIESLLKKVDQNLTWNIGLRFQNHKFQVNTIERNHDRFSLLFGMGFTFF